MSRAVRIIKHAAKRHHLHIETEPIEELNPGLLFSSHSRSLIAARGVIGDCETIVMTRQLELKIDHKAAPSQVTATIVAVPLLQPLKFLIEPTESNSQLRHVITHTLSAWVKVERPGHWLHYPPDEQDEQALLERTATHLPKTWSAEGSGGYLQLFKSPAETEEAALEEVLRLAGELRPLLVAA